MQAASSSAPSVETPSEVTEDADVGEFFAVAARGHREEKRPL